MIIKAIDNQNVEINIMNYQFPNTNDRSWDGNWLNIYLKVESNLGNYQTIDPALTTWEVQEIIDWFNQLSNDSNPKWMELGFTEPNLSFELLNNPSDKMKKIRIKFDLEFRPQSANNKKEYYVEIESDNKELKRIAAELKHELEKYPERKK